MNAGGAAKHGFLASQELRGGRNNMRFIAKQFDDGTMTISLPYEVDEVEIAIRAAERQQRKLRIKELAEALLAEK
jgi:hypothetical protein